MEQFITDPITCKIIRSSRKTLALEINADGLVVRAPKHVSDAEIKFYIQKHRNWIEKNLKKAQERQTAEENIVPLTDEELKALAKDASTVIKERVEYYAPKVGVTYNRITIRNQRTKWGSCSGKGNLNFNCLLLLAPPEVLDSVVVHELCHLKEMNHSEKFYAEVLRVYPDYPTWNRWLKDNGSLLIKRMPKYHKEK